MVGVTGIRPSDLVVASPSYSAEGSFGLTDPVFKCRRSERSEYVIYGSKAACLRNLETMKANAP